MTKHAKQQLIEFREKLYQCFPKRKDAIMNLLDSLTSDGHHHDSVIALSESKQFERQYSSITDAIADGLPYAQWSLIMQLTHDYARAQSDQSPHRFILDCTGNPRPFARKLKDKTIVHTPNPAPGNKPIAVGHQYSVLAMLPNHPVAEKKHWLVPLSAERVESTQKGNERGMRQLIGCIEQLTLSHQLVISMGDSLYGTTQCRTIASEKENLVHLFRLNSQRNIYFPPEKKEGLSGHAGRQQEFGQKLNLKTIDKDTLAHQEAETDWVSAKGKQYRVKIRSWDNMLLRGSQQFRSSEHPINVLQIIVLNEANEPIFKRPLWLGVFGKRRHEISLVDAYKNYRSRYDIEHFFRFGKNKLLMDRYQTADTDHEALWWRLTQLAYMQLYLGKELIAAIPKPWERYLPEYKLTNKTNSEKIATPSQTQRAYKTLLDHVGTPAMPCIARGRSPGRMLGEVMLQKPDEPIIFKRKKMTKKSTEKTVDPILSGSVDRPDLPNPQKIDELLHWTQTKLEAMNYSVPEFIKLLENTS